MRLSTVITAGFMAISAATAADAGNKTLKHADGSRIKLNCTGAGCTVKTRPAGEKKYAVTEKTKGGTKNYNLLLAKYKELGYK